MSTGGNSETRDPLAVGRGMFEHLEMTLTLPRLENVFDATKKTEIRTMKVTLSYEFITIERKKCLYDDNTKKSQGGFTCS
jgi:hypothetical protein